MLASTKGRRRFDLPLLLAPPAAASAYGRGNNPYISQLVARLNSGDAANIPACEMREVFSALAEECRGGGIELERGVSMEQPTRKRARSLTNSNNLHALIRLVERAIEQRYNQNQRCKCPQERFLDEELRSYFGTEETSFQVEEDVLCLAFEVALNAIKQSCGEDDDGGGDRPSVLTAHCRSSSAVQTALRIIDSVVLISERERAAVRRLQLAKSDSRQTYTAKSGGRRAKYEHLLRPNKKGRVLDSGPPSESKSVMEERYPKQWEWLHRFRAQPESVCETEVELQQSHYPQPNLQTKKSQDDIDDEMEDEISGGSQFVVVRRKIPTFDDISVSSGESDVNTNEGGDGRMPRDKQKYGESPRKDDSGVSPDKPSTASNTPVTEAGSPYDKLDKESRELRLALLDMPPGESASTEVVQHTVEEIGGLLARYGELDGAAGISRCGDIIGKAEPSSGDTHQFPLNDALVSALVKEILTDAMGALRAKAFLRSFVLPLMIEMNPIATAAASMGLSVEGEKVSKEKCKPASRSLTSLLATLARDRPTECVVSLVVPSLVLRKYVPTIALETDALFEPTRFQCELVSRILRGKDALSTPAIATLVELLLPTVEGTSSSGGMKWTDHSMPLLTACLNRQPLLSDEVVTKVADEIQHLCQSMVKSMKFSSLFHALVMKYGAQLKTAGRVEPLKGSAAQLKTFMAKTIGLSLKKLS